MTKSEIKDILGLWYYQENLKTVYPDKALVIATEADTLPWLDKDKQSNKSKYTLYAVKTSLACLASLLAEKDCPQAALKPSEKEDYTVLYTLDIDQDGNYIKDSFKISKLAFFISALLDIDNENFINLNSEASLGSIYKNLNQAINQELSEAKANFSEEVILNLNKSILNILFETNDEIFNPDSFTITKLKAQAENPQKAFNHYLKAAVNSLDRDNLLAQYVANPLEKQSKQASLEDYQLWSSNLEPQDYQKVKWPSAKYLSSDEAWVINDINKQKDNSLKSYQITKYSNYEDIIANTLSAEVYQQASILNKLQKPQDAFTMRKFRRAANRSSKNYYSPLYSLSKHNLLLVSDDAASLKASNKKLLSKAAIKNARTNDFSLDNQEDIYFTKLANKLNSQANWGLASYYIDSLDSLKALVDLLLKNFSKASPYRQKLLYGANYILDFKEAKQEFSESETELDNSLAKSQAAYLRAKNYIYQLEAYKDLKRSLEHNQAAVEALLEDIESLKLKHKLNYEEISNRKIEYKRKDKEVNFFKKLFFKIFNYGEDARELAIMKENIHKVERKSAELVQKIEENYSYIQEVKARSKDIEEEAKQVKNKLQSLEYKINADRKNYPDNYLDLELYENPNSQAAHETLAFINEDVEVAREKLFRASLDLLKAFLLESTEVEQNLERFKLVLEGKYNLQDTNASWQDLFNSLSLFVPILIIPRKVLEQLFIFAEANANGTIIYLGAERNKPSDLVSSLYLANRLIVFTDFLSVSKDSYSRVQNYLCENVAHRLNIDSIYAGSIYGAKDFLIYSEDYVFDINNSKIAFPLREAYHSSEPIYSLQNKVCLNNLLFKGPLKAEPEYKYFLEATAWQDVAIDDESLISQEEANKVLDALIKYFKEAGQSPDLAFVFLFNDVYSTYLSYCDKYLDAKLEDKELRYEIKEFIQENAILLSKWDGKMYTEAIFILANPNTRSDKYLAKISQDIRPLNTVFNLVKSRLLILANKETWTKNHFLDNLNTALDELKEIK